MTGITQEERKNRTYTAAAGAIYAVLQYTSQKDSYTLTDVMGLTGHAFRINIHPEDVSPAGPTMFSPTELLEKGLNNLGFAAEQLYGFPTPAPLEKLEQAIRFAQETIDRGIPAIGWSLFTAEFGVIYGYDDEKQELYCSDRAQDGPLPYAKLNELQMKFVFMLRIIGELTVDPLAALKTALAGIVQFARGKAPTLSDTFKHGLAGYDAWIQAFEGGKVNPFGNADNARIVGDAREYAVEFLRSLSEKWTGDGQEQLAIRSLSQEALPHFERVVEAFRALQLRFPFPHGGEPNDPVQAAEAIKLLTVARDSETAGIAVLERLLEQLNMAEA
ncbi:hypothetical protein DFQ01_12091 [Paenibacillus cellulosilyticus]|uniref:Uncharacterized protein n=1 Tax=Paenibacillus cellulosilyticus TaxID=375489 RepID=A0A2V2YP79_9BACL|nr:hypothetical protein [Paenibacillus cellulosilyticus]PWV97904.1 hypothetical protein DFQ01_12091 [Paenibacillus cellulosilyticus]QKS46927.1 hypothetical protein HUB94_20860 [Paenibacillus cellulosilyticus]